LGSLGDRENTHDLDSVSWSALVGEISINCEEKGSWHLSCWDQLWSLLQLDYLLINIFALVGIHLISVESAVSFVCTWSSLPIANRWGNCSCESEWNIHNLLMATVTALEYSLSSPNGTLTGTDNNSGKADKFTNQVTLQISEHLGILI